MQGLVLRPVREARVAEDWQHRAYHRLGMHKDGIHNAFAHYGVRDPRYKLIHWYNDPLDQPGAQRGDEPPEWELFDCMAESRSEEHTSELQSLMRISYAVFCLKKKKKQEAQQYTQTHCH